MQESPSAKSFKKKQKKTPKAKNEMRPFSGSSIEDLMRSGSNVFDFDVDESKKFD